MGATMSEDWWNALVTYEMKVATEHVDPILNHEKTLTVRLDSEWRHVFDRDALRWYEAGGEPVAEAVVKRARTLSLHDAFHVVNAHSGHKSYDEVDAFGAELQEYYPDVGIHWDTDLRLIHFEVTDDE